MVEKKSPAASSGKSNKTAQDQSTLSVMDKTRFGDSPSQIDLAGSKLPPSQRYDAPIGIKDGLKKKKVRPVYKVTTAPVYDPVKERGGGEETSLLTAEESMLGDSKREGDGGGGEDSMSPMALNLILVTAIVSFLIGAGCAIGCLVMILQKF